MVNNLGGRPPREQLLDTQALRTQKKSEKVLDFYRKSCYIILMTKTEMLKEISILHETLKDSVLSPADRVAIRNEIGDLQDRVALLDFQEVEDIDFGWHDQTDF
jgi:hypothetical protein